jgi:hypothetical protein
MGDKDRIQLIQWKIRFSHRGHCTVASIEEQELAVDKDGCTRLRPTLRQRAGRAAQNGCDAVGTLHRGSRFVGSLLLGDDSTAKNLLQSTSLKGEYADNNDGENNDGTANNHISFGQDSLLVL